MLRGRRVSVVGGGVDTCFVELNCLPLRDDTRLNSRNFFIVCYMLRCMEDGTDVVVGNCERYLQLQNSSDAT